MQNSVNSRRVRESFNDGWKFSLDSDPVEWMGWAKAGDFTRTGKVMLPEYEHLFTLRGPATIAYDDSKWRVLNLPHDWLIEQPPTPAGRLQDGWLKRGVGWYRKHFHVPAQEEGQRFLLEFEGVFRDCAVFCNGCLVQLHRSGYAPFVCDLTSAIEYGQENVLSIRVDASLKEGWFYEGAGIYRDVWLTRTAPVHIAPDGLWVRSELANDQRSAGVDVEVEIRNDSDRDEAVEVVIELTGPKGQPAGQYRQASTAAWGSTTSLTKRIEIADAQLWSCDLPNLYRCKVSIEQSGQTLDAMQTPFGLRRASFTTNGFFLNGVKTTLKGVCIHQFHGGVGWALPRELIRWRLQRLLDMGANAIRTHYPSSSDLLTLCDEMGMLLLAETRMTGTSTEATDQLQQLVRSNRNHPCVIAWCMANEEMAIQGTPTGRHIMDEMKRLTHRLDPTRPVVAASNREFTTGFVQSVDAYGVNYWPCDNLRQQFPNLPFFYSEAASTICTRGVYHNDPLRCYASAYDWPTSRKDGGSSSAEQAWRYVAERPWLGGTFIWAGFDYRGEQSPYRRWPSVGSHYGILDEMGFPKDHYFYYQSWWTEQPVLHLFPHWNWAGREGETIEVWCFSNCRSVELFLNGRSLGRQSMPRNGHLEWHVPYQPGELRAVGDFNGQPITRQITTTGPAAALTLHTDRTTLDADSKDLAMIALGTVDEHGRAVATSDCRVELQLIGPLRIIGVGNGDPSSHEPGQGNDLRLFNGLAMAIVQSTGQSGQATITARAGGLKPAVIELQLS